MAFITSCSFINVKYFIECCRKVYFAIEDYSIAVFVIVNAGLYYLFQENADKCLEYHHLCRDNLETALSNWPLLHLPNKEMIETLLLGATYSIEISKFTIGYQLNSAAAARTTGRNCAASSSQDEAAVEGQEIGMVQVAGIEDESPHHRRAMSLEMILKSGQVSHLASLTLTLIYRGIPSAPGFSSPFNAECIEAARMAFNSHAECMKLSSDSRFAELGYLNWTILYAPFTPFTILFCHVIETSNAEGLQRLEHFAASLQPLLSMSPAIDKFQHLCKVLHQAAALYIGAKAQAQQDHDLIYVFLPAGLHTRATSNGEHTLWW
ncbi:hypothetical protein QQZ08_002966 [Neonectria magnoliae]|uniref:Uncharacterized protein n=1 Tax=Neonectria magnoliae TaxID=2732573 RepID=A0ABR1IBZ3_9HYPO